MDTVRYVFALLWLVSFPVLLFWILLHPFVDFWRRMGRAATYTILLGAWVAAGVLLYAKRDFFLAVELGTHPALWGLTAAFYAASLAVEIPARRHLSTRTLVGVPELAEETGEEGLLQEGIYARMRHPRYVGAAFGYVASACFANYLFLWAALPLFLFLLHTVVLLEERELLDRFGPAYARYMERVPRYVPRRRSASV